MAASLKLPYWRLSGFYFYYFAALGVFLPYWSLYLESLGFNHAQIGQLMAILPATKVISPNLWGWLADHTDSSVLLIKLSSLFTAFSFALVFWGNGFLWLAWTMLAVGFFWNASMPLIEALTLAYLHKDAHRYSRVRLWGSLGFVLAVFIAGWALKSLLAIQCLPQPLFLLFGAMAFVGLILPNRTVRVRGEAKGTLRAIFKRPGVVAFFFVFLLLQTAHGPYYSFFSVYLKESGYDAEQTGLLWSLAIVAEIVFFWFFTKGFKQFSLRSILLTAIALSALRWWLIAWWVQELGLIALAQILHAASFGAAHLAAVQFIHRHFAWPHEGKGQAFYSSLSFGLGGMIGSYASGEVWDDLGPQFVFSSAAVLAVVAWLVAFAWVERQPAKRV